MYMFFIYPMKILKLYIEKYYAEIIKYPQILIKHILKYPDFMFLNYRWNDFYDSLDKISFQKISASVFMDRF